MVVMLRGGCVCVEPPGVDGRQWKQLAGSVLGFAKSNYLDITCLQQTVSVLFGCGSN